MTKNRLADLNDHLFAQLERLGNEDLTTEQIETEVKRGNEVVAVADQILRHATLRFRPRRSYLIRPGFAGGHLV
jgi:hypothetical protein